MGNESVLSSRSATGPKGRCVVDSASTCKELRFDDGNACTSLAPKSLTLDHRSVQLASPSARQRVGIGDTCWMKWWAVAIDFKADHKAPFRVAPRLRAQAFSHPRESKDACVTSVQLSIGPLNGLRCSAWADTSAEAIARAHSFLDEECKVRAIKVVRESAMIEGDRHTPTGEGPSSSIP